MFQEKRILAVVPARGGSKGVPQKNIHPLAGKPLIVHTAELIKCVPEIDRSVVSTDSPEVAEISERAGLRSLGLRPDDLSGDRVPDLPVLQHELRQAEKYDKCTYEVVLMLQPTSPLREVNDIHQCLEKLIAGKMDTVWTVSKVDLKFHPLKLLKLSGEKMELYDPAGKEIIARQQLHPLYYRNGICYAFSRACLLELESIYGKNAGAVILDRPVVNIDTLNDFKCAERIMGFLS